MAQEEWDEFADPVLTETRRRAKIKGGIPYDAADSYLKREVYRFVRRQMLKKRITYIETIVQQVRFPYKPKSPTFRENPFHWVLFGLRDPEENVDWPKKWQVSRFGRQLLYAHRHDIEPDLLIGFLHQSGTPDEVYEKAADSNVREEWFHIARARDLAGELPST